MPDYVVCIPSYKRAETCNEKTLKMLKNNKISASKIYVYVANDEEYKEYLKVLDKKLYNKLVVGIKGLVPQRQFIMEQWKEGQHIVFFDDDVQSIDLSISKLFKGKTLDYFFKYAFKECVANKSSIWGVYPVYNPFFREARDETSTCLNYIVGAFYGIINRPKLKSIQLSITKENGQKEDVERTIKYFIEDGVVLRFNRVGFVTKYYGKSGGLGTFEDRLKPMLEASNKIKAAYPDYGNISTKKTGMTEFKLKKIPATINMDGKSTRSKPKQGRNKTRKRK
jgi:cellulose synthase/poly-beta-1,6-N-acetylglucosamine synthase-like glycosyltransferase